MASLSRKQRKYIKENVGRRSLSEIARELGMGERRVARAAREMGLSVGRAPLKKAPVSFHSLKWTTAVTIAAAIVTVAIYARSVNYPFVFDDHHAIVDNVPLHNAANFWSAFTDPGIFSDQPGRRMYRPIVTASYILNWAIFGDKPAGWRVLNFIIHVANGVILFLLLELLTERRLISALVSLAFVAHPGATEAVAFMSARSTLMAAFFVLAAFYFFARWSVEERAGLLIATLTALALGLLCKENVIMLVAVFPLIYWATSGASLRETFSPRAFVAYGCAAAIGAIYLAVRKWGFGLPTAVLHRSDRTFADQSLTQAGVWWRYFATVLWPVWLNAYRYIEVKRSLWSAGAGFFGQPLVWMLGWAALAALVIANWKNRLALLGAAFAATILIPETVTTLNLLSADRRLYIPLVGIAIIVVSPFRGGGEGGPTGAKWWYACMAVATLLYMVLSFVRVGEWRTEQSVFRSTIRHTPLSHVAWHGLAYVYGQEENFDKAVVCLKHALSINPRYAASLRLLGAIYIRQGRLREALQLLEKSVRYEPKAQRGWYNLSLAQMKLGYIEEAERSLRRAIEQDPYYSQAYNNMGVIYENKDMVKRALKYYEKAAMLDPKNISYKINLERVREKLRRSRKGP